MMKLGDAMHELALCAADEKKFDKWVLEKRACLDKGLLPRFTKELSSIKKTRKSKKISPNVKLHWTLVFIFFWEARDDWRVENFSFQMTHATIEFMQQTSNWMIHGEELKNFDFLKSYMYWSDSVLEGGNDNELDNNGKNIRNNGQENTNSTTKNNFEGNGEF